MFDSIKCLCPAGNAVVVFLKLVFKIENTIVMATSIPPWMLIYTLIVKTLLQIVNFSSLLIDLYLIKYALFLVRLRLLVKAYTISERT